MAKFEGYKDIYVFVEQKNGTIAEVGYELISEARKLVASIPEMGYQVVGVLLGSNITDKAQEVIVHGADKVIVVDDELLKDYSTQFYTDALTQIIKEFKPDSFLTGATVLGRDLAPRVAARINAGLTADATKIEIDTDKAKKVLGWNPCYNADEAVEKTVSWYKQFYAMDNILACTLQQIKDYERAMNGKIS